MKKTATTETSTFDRPARLKLVKERVRALTSADLSRAAGGNGCDTGSITTEVQGH
jgi:hypothetical protein